MNFLDPQLTSDGKPYAPFKYKQIIKECYLIAKNCNTPYTSLLDISITEKNELLRLIIEENEKTKEAMDNAKEEAKARKQNKNNR